MAIAIDVDYYRAPAVLNAATLKGWHKFELFNPELAERRAISYMNRMYLTQAQMLQALIDNHVPNAEAVCEMRWFAAPVFADKPAFDDKVFFTQFRGEMTDKGIEYYNKRIEKNATAKKEK